MIENDQPAGMSPNSDIIQTSMTLVLPECQPLNNLLNHSGFIVRKESFKRKFHISHHYGIHTF